MKTKESWLSCVQFQHVTKCQKRILFPKKLKYRHPRNEEHTCLNFLIESQGSHTDIHVIVKLCKKPIFLLKTTLTVFPLVRKLVIKTHWHILYVVLSPLTLYWVLRGDEKQTNKKSSCTNNENKAKVGMHRFHTATNRTVPDASAGSGLGGRKPRSRTARAWCVAESVPDKPEKTHKRRWGGERDALHKRKVSGPRNCLGPLDPRTRREPSGGGAQTDQRKVTAKAMCKNWKPSFRPHPFLPSLILSVCSEWMFSPRGRYQSEGGSTEPVLGLQSAETLSSLLTPTYMCISDGWVLFFFLFFFLVFYIL